MSQTVPCSFVKSSAHSTVHHFGVEAQGSETLCHLQRLTQHSRSGTQFRDRLPGPERGNDLVYITQLNRKVRKEWCFSLWTDGETEAPGKTGTSERQGARVGVTLCGSRGPEGLELNGGARAAPAPRRPGSGVGRAGRCAAGLHGRGAWRGAATGGWSA